MLEVKSFDFVQTRKQTQHSIVTGGVETQVKHFHLRKKGVKNLKCAISHVYNQIDRRNVLF